jgi:hypothetical protein
MVVMVELVSILMENVLENNSEEKSFPGRVIIEN